MSAYKILCRSDNYPRSSCRSSWCVHTRVHAGVFPGVHAEFLQDCTMNTYRSACRRLYVSSWSASTGLNDECMQDCMQEWWLCNEFIQECTMIAYTSVCRSVYISHASSMMSAYKIVCTSVYMSSGFLQEWYMNARNRVFRSFYVSSCWASTGVHDECVQSSMQELWLINESSQECMVSAYKSARIMSAWVDDETLQ